MRVGMAGHVGILSSQNALMTTAPSPPFQSYLIKSPAGTNTNTVTFVPHDHQWHHTTTTTTQMNDIVNDANANM